MSAYFWAHLIFIGLAIICLLAGLWGEMKGVDFFPWILFISALILGMVGLGWFPLDPQVYTP